MRPDDIVGYVYQADIYGPECIVAQVCATWGIEGHGLSSVPEQALERLAISEGIEREDETTFDSDDFPKVYFRDSADDYAPTHEGMPCRCAMCGRVLTDPALTY